jgi:hypothetical protein
MNPELAYLPNQWPKLTQEQLALILVGRFGREENNVFPKPREYLLKELLVLHEIISAKITCKVDPPGYRDAQIAAFSSFLNRRDQFLRGETEKQLEKSRKEKQKEYDRMMRRVWNPRKRRGRR